MTANRVYFIIGLIVVGFIAILGLGVALTTAQNQQLMIQQLQDRVNDLEEDHADSSGGTSTPIGSENPASVYCTDSGGTHVTLMNAVGAEYSICQFEDNMACEEFAMLNGYCAVGGVNTAGYETEAQSYCALQGGAVDITTDVCTLPSGVSCTSTDLFNGVCE